MKSIIVLLTLTATVGPVAVMGEGMLDGIDEKINGLWYVKSCNGLPVEEAVPHYKLDADYSMNDGKKQLLWNISLDDGVLKAEMYDNPKESDCQEVKKPTHEPAITFMNLGLKYCKDVTALKQDNEKLKVNMGVIYCNFTREKPKGKDIMVKVREWFQNLFKKFGR